MPSTCAGAPTREPRPAAPGPPIPPYPRRADHDPPPVAPPVTPGAGRRNTPQTGIRGCHTISQTPRNPSKPRHDAPLAPDCHKVVTRPRPKTAPWAAVQERRQAVRLTSPDASGVRRTGRQAVRRQAHAGTTCGDTPKATPRQTRRNAPSCPPALSDRNAPVRRLARAWRGVFAPLAAFQGVALPSPCRLPGGLRHVCARDGSASARPAPPHRMILREMGICSPLQNISTDMARPWR